MQPVLPHWFPIPAERSRGLLELSGPSPGTPSLLSSLVSDAAGLRTLPSCTAPQHFPLLLPLAWEPLSSPAPPPGASPPYSRPGFSTHILVQPRSTHTQCCTNVLHVCPPPPGEPFQASPTAGQAVPTPGSGPGPGTQHGHV